MANQLLLVFALVGSLAASAGDLGFRAEILSSGGKNYYHCKDRSGKSGHNPDLFGECGELKATLDLRRQNLTDRKLVALKFDTTGAFLFRGADLSRSDLSGSHAYVMQSGILDFQQANLSSTLLRDSRFSGVNFTRARLDYADLSRADVHYSNFTNASLREAILTSTEFRDCIMDGADLVGAKFSSTSFFQARLHGALLNKTDLSGASLQDADLSGADLRGANATKAYVGSTDFTGAHLEGADFRGVDLGSSNFRNTDLEKAQVAGAKFRIDRPFATGLPFDRKHAESLGMICTDYYQQNGQFGFYPCRPE